MSPVQQHLEALHGGAFVVRNARIEVHRDHAGHLGLDRAGREDIGPAFGCQFVGKPAFLKRSLLYQMPRTSVPFITP